MSLPAAFPSGLDALSNPTATTNRDDPGFELDLVVGRIHDILEALEAKLGVGASLPSAAGGLLRQTGSGTSGWGTLQSADIGTAQVTQAKLATNLVGTFRSIAISTPSIGVSGGFVGVSGSNLPSFTGSGRPMLLGVTFQGMGNGTASSGQVQIWDGSQSNFNVGQMLNETYQAGVYLTRSSTSLVTPVAGQTHGYFVVWNNAAGTLSANIMLFWSLEIV